MKKMNRILSILLFSLISTISWAQYNNNYYYQSPDYAHTTTPKNSLTMDIYFGYTMGTTTIKNINHGIDFGLLFSIKKIMFGFDAKLPLTTPNKNDLDYGLYGIIGYKDKYFGVGGIFGYVGINDQLQLKNGGIKTGYDYYWGTYGYYDPNYKYYYYSDRYKFDYGIFLVQNIPTSENNIFGITITEQVTRYSWFSIALGFYLNY